MIPKRINKKPDVRDNYTHLAEYIAAAREKGEKLDAFWIVNCDAGDSLEDLETALAEIEAVRAMKPEIDDKTYHLVVSLPVADREKLSAEDWKDIERHFAKALGFADHQRVAGTHINTDNIHMHVAYNMVNPHTMKLHRPFQDFRVLEQTARAMEAKYGLTVDRGLSDAKGQTKGSRAAKDFEARTWQESFETHLLSQRDDLMKVIREAGSWQDLHAGLARFGIEARLRGNGLVFAQANGKQAMKASLLDRSASLPALQKRFGAFEPAPQQKAAQPKPERLYQALPVRRHPETERLWQDYRKGKQSTLLGRVAGNWRSYLLVAASKDPRALVLLLIYQEMFHTIGSIGEGFSEGWAAPRPLPQDVREAMAHWRDAGHWAPSRMRGPRVAGPGCRLDDQDNLVVPYRDGDGHLRGVRLVDPQGQTLDVGKVAEPGMRHVVGKLPDDASAAYITADYKMALKFHRQTGTPVIVVAKPEAVPAMTGYLRRADPKFGVTVLEPKPSKHLDLDML